MLPELIFDSLFLKNYWSDIMETKLTAAFWRFLFNRPETAHLFRDAEWELTKVKEIEVFFLKNSISLIRQTEEAIPSCSGLNEESLAGFVHVQLGKKASLADTDQGRSPSALLVPFSVVMRRRSSSSLGSLTKKNNPKLHTTMTTERFFRQVVYC